MFTAIEIIFDISILFIYLMIQVEQIEKIEIPVNKTFEQCCSCWFKNFQISMLETNVVPKMITSSLETEIIKDNQIRKYDYT